jgi:predicted PurR-regulated permease PerM
MLLALVAIAGAVVLMVLGGLVSQRGSIESTLQDGLTKITDAVGDAGVGGGGTAKGDIEKALPEIGSTLVEGAVQGISGLTSIVFFLSFLALGVFFLLKDGPGMRRTIERHLGLPAPVARLVTSEILVSLRRYFAGLTIVAAFNAVVVGLGAWLLDVPLAGTIAIVAFVTAYVPYVGAFVSGTFTVVLALADQGPATAAAMLVIFILANGLLQQLVQPIAFGATLDLNPLVVLIVTISGGALFGMVGLILAAPLTSAFVHIAGALARAREEAEASAPEPAAPS